MIVSNGYTYIQKSNGRVLRKRLHPGCEGDEVLCCLHRKASNCFFSSPTPSRSRAPGFWQCYLSCTTRGEIVELTVEYVRIDSEGDLTFGHPHLLCLVINRRSQCNCNNLQKWMLGLLGHDRPNRLCDSAFLRRFRSFS